MLEPEQIKDKLEEVVVLQLRDGMPFPQRIVIEDEDFDEILNSISAEKEDSVYISTVLLGRVVEIWRKSWGAQ